MSNSSFKNRILSYYGIKDTDFPDTLAINGNEKVAIVQDNLNVLTTINDLLSLMPVGFITAPKSINSIESMMNWFKNLKPSQGKVLGAVVSYFDRDSGTYEVIRYVGPNFNDSSIYDYTNWEWFTTGSSQFKGLYNTEAELRLAIKNPKLGDHAFVGTTLGESFLFKCTSKGVWSKSDKVFKDLVSKYDVVYAEPKGETLEYYDDFIAERALMDAEGNVIHSTYSRKSDYNTIIKELKDSNSKILKDYLNSAKYKILLNTDDLRFGVDNKLEFTDRLNTSRNRYGFIYLRDTNILKNSNFQQNAKNIYAIRYKHELQANTIKIPDNTILDFTFGGQFLNGTLEFGENCIVRILDRDQLSNITFTGNPYKTLDANLAQKGDTGLSAYEEAKNKGLPNTETFEKWVESFKGKDGKTPKIEISSNNTWVIDGVDTNKKSKGEDGRSIKGDPGIQGDKGNDGITPKFKVEDKWLQVSYDKGVNWERLFQFADQHVPPSVRRADVYSFSKVAFEEATNQKLKERSYVGELYKGDIMSDNTFVFKSTLSYETENKIFYGNTDSYSSSTVFGGKSQTYQYAYSVVTHNWKSENIVVLSYDKIGNRSPLDDWRDPNVAYPISEIYLSGSGSYDNVNLNTLRDEISTIKVRKVENGVLNYSTLNTIGTTFTEELPLEVSKNLNDLYYLYRVHLLNNEKVLRLNGHLSDYTKSSYLKPTSPSETKFIESIYDNKRIVTIANDYFRELQNIVVNTSNKEVVTRYIYPSSGSNIEIESVRQYDKVLPKLIRDNKESYTYDLNSPIVINYTVSGKVADEINGGKKTVDLNKHTGGRLPLRGKAKQSHFDYQDLIQPPTISGKIRVYNATDLGNLGVNLNIVEENNILK